MAVQEPETRAEPDGEGPTRRRRGFSLIGAPPGSAVPASRATTLVLRWAKIVGVLLLVAAPFLVNDFSILLLTSILVFGLFGASLDLLIGVTGLPSLGHAAYYGIGAYASALFTMYVQGNVILALLVGTVAGAIGAALTGWVTVRTRGVYFLMLTVAITEIIFSLSLSWTEVTGGTNGLTVGAPHLAPGVEIILDGYVYWYVLAAVFVGYVIIRFLSRSPFGRTLRGIRENEPRMRALGYPTARYKFAIYCIAGAFAGAAGSLSVANTGFVSPTDASFETAAMIFIAVIVGGSGTLYGAFLGAIVVILVRDELSTVLPGHATLVLGIIFVIVIYLLPQGLAGAARQLGARFSRRPSRTEGDGDV